MAHAAQDPYRQDAQHPVIPGELVQPLAGSHRAGDVPVSAPHPSTELTAYAPQPYATPHPATQQPYAPPAQAAPVGFAQPTMYPPMPAMPIEPPKSVAVALVLTFFFGPLGMFYSTVTGALIMLGAVAVYTVLTVVISLLTFGIAGVVMVPLACLFAPASMIWGGLAASAHNERIRAAQPMAPMHPPLHH